MAQSTKWELKIPVPTDDPFESNASCFVTVPGPTLLSRHFDAVKEKFGVDEVLEVKQRSIGFGTEDRQIGPDTFRVSRAY